ncbi:hypothetical protein MN608_02705 [Microdochium nivale]|nr:hypothetical protein MN608_02705 [Microdochium nivale]
MPAMRDDDDDDRLGDVGDIDHLNSDTATAAGDQGARAGRHHDRDHETAAAARPDRLEPISGAVLYEMEMRRRLVVRPSSSSSFLPTPATANAGGGVTEGEVRKAAAATPAPPSSLRIGCKELDDHVLLCGGFERGSVFGVSSEGVEFGMLVGLQALARSLVTTDGGAPSNSSSKPPRAAVITTLPASAILRPLQSAVRAQVLEKHGSLTDPGGQDDEVNAEIGACLGRVSISRVFDIVGLWQVLDEFEASSRTAHDDGSCNNGPPNDDDEDGGGNQLLGDEAPEERRTEKHTGDSQTGPHHHETDGVIASEEDASSPLSSPPATQNGPPSPATSLPPLRPPIPVRRAEVFDSEDDEDELLSSPPGRTSTKSPELPQRDEEGAAAQPAAAKQGLREARTELPKAASDPPAESSPAVAESLPDMILVTHFSTLLSTLFAESGTDRSSAHTTLQLLSSHMRYLARSSGSVVMLLNTTAAHNDTSRASAAGRGGGAGGGGAALNTMNISNRGPAAPSRPLDPTLRSIFNPVPIMTTIMNHSNGDDSTNNSNDTAYYAAAAAASMLSRRNKPSFGLTFAQFLDVHLLCSRIPRTRGDAEMMVVNRNASIGARQAGYQQQQQQDQNQNQDLFSTTTTTAATAAAVEYCWAVEVLLDELGVWLLAAEEGNSPAPLAAGERDEKVNRVNREQRWGAVQVSSETGQIEDAFGIGGEDEIRRRRRYEELVEQGPIRLAAGFGGRRV